MRQRLSDIESELDVDIELTSKGEADFAEYYVASIGSGMKLVDIFYRGDYNSLWDLAVGGVLFPMTDFPDFIDLSDSYKYGTPGVLEAAMINGVPYAVQPSYWPGLQGVECCILTYNADRFQTLGLTPLHEYYENKEWTWDTFLKYCDFSSAVISKDEDEKIFCANPMYLLNLMFYSNGFDYVDVEDGVPQLNLGDSSAVTSIEFYQKLFAYEDSIKYVSSVNDNDSFIEGKTLSQLVLAQYLITGEIAYGIDFAFNIVPFPNGPDVEYGEWGQTVTRIFGLAIPTSSESPEMSAHIISELAEPFEEFGGSREGLYEYYKENVFLSDLDVDIFFELEKDVRYDYDDANLLFDYVENIAGGSKENTAIALIQKYAPNAEKIYYKYIEPNLTGYMIEALNITE